MEAYAGDDIQWDKPGIRAGLIWKMHDMMTSSNGNIFRVTAPLCGEFPVTGEFPSQRPVTRSFGVFYDLRLNIRLSKQSWGWWFETPSRPLWRHSNENRMFSSREPMSGVYVDVDGYVNWERRYNITLILSARKITKSSSTFSAIKTLIAIEYNYFNSMIQSKWNQITHESTIIMII